MYYWSVSTTKLHLIPRQPRNQPQQPLFVNRWKGTQFASAQQSHHQGLGERKLWWVGADALEIPEITWYVAW